MKKRKDYKVGGKTWLKLMETKAQTWRDGQKDVLENRIKKMKERQENGEEY